MGIIHHYRVLPTDITTQLGPAWQWVLGYLLAMACLYLVRMLLVCGYEPEAKAPGPAFDRTRQAEESEAPSGK